jgi:hypothetical protein
MDFSGGDNLSSAPIISLPLNMMLAELVKISLETLLEIAAAMIVLVPSTLTFQYKAASSRPCCGEAV